MSQAPSIQEGFEKADGATGALVRKYLASADLEGSEKEPLKVLVKEEKSVIIEAAVADLMQFAELLIWENPEIQKKMQEMDLKPEDVKVTYSVVATKESQVMVKMLLDATQLEVLMKRPAGEYQPKDTHRSLFEILSQRHHRDVCRAQDILAFTSAVSTVLSFTVYLGDRHAGNVMRAMSCSGTMVPISTSTMAMCWATSQECICVMVRIRKCAWIIRRSSPPSPKSA